jgi:major membrane immunogen (membrane-anchored lipoprotein)
VKIYNKIVYDKNDNIIEEDSYEYHGQVAQAGGASKVVKAIVVVAAVVAIAVVLGPKVGTLFKGANMKGFFMKALVSIGTSIIGGIIGQKLAPKIDPPNFNTNLDTGVTTSAKAPTAPYRIIYGETRVGGTIVFAETTSATNEFLHVVYVMAGHEVDEISEIYLNDDEVSLETSSNDSNGIPIFTPTSSDQYNGKLQIKKHLGNDDQVADATLVSALSNWTTNHRIQGKAYIYARFSFDSDVYPNGVPNLSAVIKGKKCFDPRATSFTASSGTVSTSNNTITISSHGLSTHDRAKYDVNGNTAIGGLSDGTTYFVIKVDANTIKLATNFTNCQAGTAISLTSVTGSTTQKFNFTTHTDNPVLCTRDYLSNNTYGLQTTDDEINDTNFIASANICDESVSVTNPSGTEKRFTCNGSFTLQQTPKVIIENLMTTCGGYLIYTNGKFKLIPSTYLTPTVTLTEKNLRSGLAINTRVSKKELFNAVKGLYSEPTNDYQPQNYPILTNSSFESEDNNERIFAEFDYPFTNSSRMCQRLSKIQLLKNRQQISFSGSFDMGAFDCQVGDTVNITNSRMGWSNKTYQVIDWGFDFNNEDGGLQITAQFKETASAVYDFSTSDYSTVSSGKATNLPKATQVSPPQAISLSDELVEYNDGTVIVKLVIDITAATDNFTEIYEVEIKQTKDANGNAVSNDYVNIGRAARTKFEFLNVIDKASYQVRVRGVNIYGVFSASLESSEHEVVGLTAPPADVENLSINIVGKDAFLNWTAVADLDLAYYELRYQNVSSGAQWQNSVPLVLKVARPATSVSVAAKTGAYLIKARDKLNNPSVNATVVYTSVTSIGNFNAVATSTQNPTFSGTKTDVILITKEDGTPALVLDTNELFDDNTTDDFDDITSHNFDGGTKNANVDTEGFYDFDAPIDIGSSFKANVTGGITQSVISRDRLFDNISGNFDAQTGLFDGDAESNCSAELQVATSDDGTTYTSFTTFVVGDYSARFFKFRIRMTSTNGSATPEITEASVTIDMEDRIQSENNIVSGAGAKTITYPTAFKQAPALGLAVDNMSSGDKYDITSKTATGFVITFRNSSGTAVSRTFDYIAKGF